MICLRGVIKTAILMSIEEKAPSERRHSRGGRHISGEWIVAVEKERKQHRAHESTIQSVK